MKLLISISSLAFVLFFANQAFATHGKPDFIIKNSEEKILYFEAKSMTSKDFEVRIQDDNGAVIFSEYGVNPDTFKRKYNLSELQNGKYFLFFESDTEIQMLPIIMDSDEMKVDLKHLEIIQKREVG